MNDYDEISVKIEIISKSISNSIRVLNLLKLKGDAIDVPEFKKFIAKESEKLQELKEKYPEYFI